MKKKKSLRTTILLSGMLFFFNIKCLENLLAFVFSVSALFNFPHSEGFAEVGVEMLIFLNL